MNTTKLSRLFYQLTMTLTLVLSVTIAWGECRPVPTMGPKDFTLSRDIEILKSHLQNLQSQIEKRGLVCNFNFVTPKWYRYGKMSYSIPTQLTQDPRESIKITITQGTKPINIPGSLPAPTNRKTFTANACAIAFFYTEGSTGKEREGIFFINPTSEYDCLFPAR